MKPLYRRSIGLATGFLLGYLWVRQDWEKTWLSPRTASSGVAFSLGSGGKGFPVPQILWTAPSALVPLQAALDHRTVKPSEPSSPPKPRPRTARKARRSTVPRPAFLSDPMLPAKTRRDMERMQRQGQQLLQQYLGKKRLQLREKGFRVDSREALVKALRKDTETTQVTITNPSTEQREVSLWESNQGKAVSPPLLTDVEDHVLLAQTTLDPLLGAMVHPQAMVYNPANGLTYVAAQLSDTVVLVETDGRPSRAIALDDRGFPGLYAPVDVAVNTSTGSAGYGEVFVIGSVANALSVVTTDFQVRAKVPVGRRPMSVVYNPQNELVYVACLLDTQVYVFDASSLALVDLINAFPGAKRLGVNPVLGDVLIIPEESGIMPVIDVNLNLKLNVLTPGPGWTAMAYQPQTEEVYLLDPVQDQVWRYHATTYVPVGTPIAVGARPQAIAYNAENNFLYVSNAEAGNLSVISALGTVQTTVDVPVAGSGLAINPRSNLILGTSFRSDTIQVVGYTEETSKLDVDPEIKEKRQEFQHEPVVVKKARFIFSGAASPATLQVRQTNAANQREEKSLAFGAYQSVDHQQNVAEVTDLEGMTVDGQNGWGFQVPPGTSVTILMDFQQLDRYHFLPETARPVSGGFNRKGAPFGLP